MYFCIVSSNRGSSPQHCESPGPTGLQCPHHVPHEVIPHRPVANGHFLSNVSFPLLTTTKTASSTTKSSKLCGHPHLGSFVARHTRSLGDSPSSGLSYHLFVSCQPVCMICISPTPGFMLYPVSLMPRILGLSVVMRSRPWFPAFVFLSESHTTQTFVRLDGQYVHRGWVQMRFCFDESACLRADACVLPNIPIVFSSAFSRPGLVARPCNG